MSFPQDSVTMSLQDGIIKSKEFLISNYKIRVRGPTLHKCIQEKK